MKAICNWKTWQSKDGKIKRIYVGEEEFLFEGDSGLPQSNKIFSEQDIKYAARVIGGKSFNELFAQVKAENERMSGNKKNVRALKKEEKEALALAQTAEEREAIILKYAQLKREAKFA